MRLLLKLMATALVILGLALYGLASLAKGDEYVIEQGTETVTTQTVQELEQELVADPSVPPPTAAEEEAVMEPESDTENLPVPNVPNTGNVLSHRVHTDLPHTSGASSTSSTRSTRSAKKSAVCKRKSHKVGKRERCKARGRRQTTKGK